MNTNRKARFISSPMFVNLLIPRDSSKMILMKNRMQCRSRKVLKTTSI
jgi:hypothetical protein